MQYQMLCPMGKEHVLGEVVVMGLSDAIDGGDTQQVGKDSTCACGLASPSALPEATQVEHDGQQAGPRPGQRELPRQQVAQSNVEVDSPSLPRIGMQTVRLEAHRAMRQGGAINATPMVM